MPTFSNIVCLACLALPAQLLAQRADSSFWKAKIELAQWHKNERTLAVEFGWGKTHRVELSVGWQQHPVNSDSLFQGRWTTYYALENQRVTKYPNGVATVFSDTTTFSGTGRPLPTLRPFEPIFTLPVRLTFKRALPFWGRSMTWFWQAGLAGTFHEFFKIQTATELQSEQTDIKTDLFPEKTEVKTVVSRYHAVQEMRLERAFLPGAAFDLGLTWQPLRHLFLEARISGGWNATTPYVEVPNPALKAVYGQFRLFAGLAF